MKIHPLWRNYWLGLIGFVVLFFAAGFGWTTLNSPVTEKKTYNAELIDAYEYGDHCGSKGRDTCTAFKGRFRENETGKTFDQDTNGFFYHRFVEQGKKPLPAYIQLSREQFGAKTPLAGDILGVITFFSAIFGLTWLFMGAFYAEIEREDYDRKKERERNKRIGFPRY